MISIRTEQGRTYDRSLANSPYEVFAEIILDGYTQWDIRHCPSGGEEAPDLTPAENEKLDSWFAVSNKVLDYLAGKSIDEVWNKLDRARNQGEALDELVNSGTE